MERYIVDGNKLEIDIENRETIDTNAYVIEIRYCIDSELQYLLKGIEIAQRWDDIPIQIFSTREECIYNIKGIVIREYENISEGSDI